MKIWQFIVKDTKIACSNIKFNLLLLLIFPLILTVLYGAMYEKVINPSRSLPKAKVTLINKDNSQYGDYLKNIFMTDEINKFIDVSEENDLESVQKKLEKNKINAAIVIPEGFSKTLEKRDSVNIKVIKSPSSGIETQIVYDIVKSYTENINNNININSLIYSSVEDNGRIITLVSKISPEIIKLSKTNYVNTVNINKDKKLSANQIFGASILAFISLFICMTVAQSMIEEKENGILSRVKSTSLKVNTVFISKLVFSFMMVFVIALSYVIISSFMGINWGSNIFYIFLAIILHSFALCGVTSILMSLFNKQATLTGTFVSIIMIMAVLGGSFYPGGMNDITLKMAKATLNYWIQDSYNKIMIGNSFMDNGLMLFSFGIIGIALGSFIMNKKSKSA